MDVELIGELLDAGLEGRLSSVAGQEDTKKVNENLSYFNIVDVVLVQEEEEEKEEKVAEKDEKVEKKKKKEKKERKRSRSRRKSSSRSRKRSRSRSHGKSRRRRSRSRSRSRSPRRRRGSNRRRRSRTPPRRRRSRSRDRRRNRSRRRSKSGTPEDQKYVKVAETAEEKVLRDRIRDQCTVLVSMLPVRATARDIATYFSQCGTIRDVRLIKDRGASVSKGFAYVELETPEEANGALRLSGALFQGRSLIVQPTQNEKNRAEAAKQAALAPLKDKNQPSRVYVGSLHFNVTEEALKTIFEPFGDVLDVVIHKDTTTGISRGFGFVTFASASEAKRAMNELNGLEILGRPMKVGECTQSSSGMVEAEDMAVGDRLEDDGALTVNQATRSLLMKKLQQRDASKSSGGDKADVAIKDVVQQSDVHVQPSRCLVLQNCFNAAEEDAQADNDNWQSEIESDVKSECETYGKVEHIKLEPDSGCIYVKFDDIKGSMGAREALNGRFFGGQTISVDFVTTTVYQKKYDV